MILRIGSRRVAVDWRIGGVWAATAGIWASGAGLLPVLARMEQSGLAAPFGWVVFLLGYSALVVFAAAASVRVMRQERSVNPFRARANG